MARFTVLILLAVLILRGHFVATKEKKKIGVAKPRKSVEKSEMRLSANVDDNRPARSKMSLSANVNNNRAVLIDEPRVQGQNDAGTRADQRSRTIKVKNIRRFKKVKRQKRHRRYPVVHDIPDFNDYKIKFRRKYRDSEDTIRRHKKYQKNADRVKKHNEKFKMGSSHFTMKINEFADMEVDEIIETMTGFGVVTIEVQEQLELSKSQNERSDCVLNSSNETASQPTATSNNTDGNYSDAGIPQNRTAMPSYCSLVTTRGSNTDDESTTVESTFGAVGNGDGVVNNDSNNSNALLREKRKAKKTKPGKTKPGKTKKKKGKGKPATIGTIPTTKMSTSQASTAVRTEEKVSDFKVTSSFQTADNDLIRNVEMTDDHNNTVYNDSGWDWRDTGCLHPVRNQGQCNSCWAFSAVAALECQWFLETGELIDGSEQQLVTCISGEAGCSALGFMHVAYDYMKKNGLASETTYPYMQDVIVDCITKMKKKKQANADIRVKKWKLVRRGDEEELREAVETYGPVTVAIAMSPEMAYYSEGVFDACEQHAVMQHAVVVIGYGVDEATGLPYWTIRNSWGTGWGDDGHIRILRGKNMCAIGEYAVYPVV